MRWRRPTRMALRCMRATDMPTTDMRTTDIRASCMSATAAQRSAGMSRHLVIMAAGTGGHIIPGLAVAEEIMRRGWTVSWLGTEHGMENKLVPPTGLPSSTLRSISARISDGT